MVAKGGPTVPHWIEAIFVHFFKCLGSYFDNGITVVGLQMPNGLWFVGMTPLFNGVSQKIAQRCQIVAAFLAVD